MEYVKISWVDYIVFALMFGISAAFGVYFGCFGKKEATPTEYLLGGRNMKVFPVAMSLVASTLSGVSLLGIPAEVYMYGTQFSLTVLAFPLMGILNSVLYLPVFYKLQLKNAFDYLELRFHRSIKTMSSVLYTLSHFLYLSVVIYAPTLALNQVSGFDIHLVASVMCLICIFYTTLGGLKAVVWADTLQFSVTFCTLGCVLIMGTVSMGGLTAVWEKAELGSRIEFFNMNPDPTVRNTFWSVTIGTTFIWLFVIATGPASVQRFMAVPTLRDAKRTLWVFVVFAVITKLLGCFSGLIMYAKYFDCDPLSAGYMKKADQILPYYVMEVASQIPGLGGLFVASLFSTSLSTLSTHLNNLSGICYRDFVAPFMSAQPSEKKASTHMKIITAIIGLISLGMVFVVERLGSILELAVGLMSICAGPILGIFTLGLLFPFANRKGAVCGGIGSLLFMSLIVIGHQIHMWNGGIRQVPKPVFTNGCNITTLASDVNKTLSFPTTTAAGEGCPPEEPFWLYRISFHIYMLVGSLAVIIVGLPISWITGSKEDSLVNPELLSPFVRRFSSKFDCATQYESVEKELDVTVEMIPEYKGPALDNILN